MESETQIKDLDYYLKEAESNKIEFQGNCHDCNKSVSVKIDLAEDGKLTVKGGAVYLPNNEVFIKCDSCYAQDPILHNYQKCDVYSRVVGFLRPTKDWNAGKQSEWKLRKEYNLPDNKTLATDCCTQP